MNFLLTVTVVQPLLLQITLTIIKMLTLLKTLVVVPIMSLVQMLGQMAITPFTTAQVEVVIRPLRLILQRQVQAHTTTHLQPMTPEIVSP